MAATFYVDVTTEAVDLSAASVVTNVDGDAAATLAQSTRYEVQCMGGNAVRYAEGPSAAPEGTNGWKELALRERLTVEFDGDPFWVRTDTGRAQLVISSAV